MKLKRLVAALVIVALGVTIEAISIQVDSVSELPVARAEVIFPTLVAGPPTLAPTPEPEEIVFEEPEPEELVIEIEAEPTSEPEPMQPEEVIQLTDNDKELLMHLAMAEMEGEGLKAKALCIRVVLNRVESDKFPNTIEGVIFDGKQFSPTFNGRWESCNSPDEECSEALSMVLLGWDESENATYFRTTEESRDTWHDRALEYLYEEGTTSFYKEK